MKRTILLLMLLAVAGCNKAAKETAAVANSGDVAASAGKAWTGGATDFTFTTFEGKSMKLSSYAGKPLVLNFWADWCPPCIGELPHFQEVYHSKRGQFELVAIDAGSNDGPGFVRQHGYDFVFGKSADAPRLYKVEGIPVTVFISRSGEVVDQVVGGMEKADFESSLAKIL